MERHHQPARLFAALARRVDHVQQRIEVGTEDQQAAVAGIAHPDMVIMVACNADRGIHGEVVGQFTARGGARQNEFTVVRNMMKFAHGHPCLLWY